VSVIRSAVTGVGAYLPDNIVTNDQLAETVDTSDAWIVERTGIRQRHKVADDQPVSDLAFRAAQQALERAGKTAADVDLIIVATTTPDMTFPATATIVQRKLGAPVGIAFDVQAVCSGFVYALALADRLIASGMARNALVVGAEIYSRILDWSDRGTCVLFGDGAGAVVLVPSDAPGILSAHLHADGRYKDMLCVPGQVHNGKVTGRPFLHMDGPAVFKFAVRVLADVAHEALDANGMTAADVDWMIPHQANVRIMDATAKKLGMKAEHVVSTVDVHANTSAASIPLALDVAVRDGRIRTGQHLLLLGVGGGFTWGSVLLRW
jgi:3-oxoacyl-[acyl-carrier-protein] synthase-3